MIALRRHLASPPSFTAQDVGTAVGEWPQATRGRAGSRGGGAPRFFWGPRRRSVAAAIGRPPEGGGGGLAKWQTADYRLKACLAAYRALDWTSISGDEVVNLIKEALATGLFHEAEELAAEGHLRFVADLGLAEYARVLAPPVVGEEKIPPMPSMAANSEWLAEHRESYRGQWVGLRNGEVVATGTSLKDLLAKLREAEPDSRISETLLTRI